MLGLRVMTRLVDAVDRFNQRHPWSHNGAYSGLVVRQANMSAPAVPATDTYRRIKNALEAGLPGAKVHRTLFWRYVAIWQNDR